MEKLSDFLQNEMAEFLKEHNSVTLPEAIKELLLFYLECKAKLGYDLLIQENINAIMELCKVLTGANRLTLLNK